jgi:hypothetical protein
VAGAGVDGRGAVVGATVVGGAAVVGGGAVDGTTAAVTGGSVAGGAAAGRVGDPPPQATRAASSTGMAARAVGKLLTAP